MCKSKKEKKCRVVVASGALVIAALLILLRIGAEPEKLPIGAFGLTLGQTLEASNSIMKDYEVPNPMPFYERYAVSTTKSGALYRIEAETNKMLAEECKELILDTHTAISEKYHGQGVTSDGNYYSGRAKINAKGIEVSVKCYQDDEAKGFKSMISYEDTELAEVAKKEALDAKVETEKKERDERLREKGIIIDYL